MCGSAIGLLWVLDVHMALRWSVAVNTESNINGVAGTAAGPNSRARMLQVEVLYQIADIYHLKQEWKRAIKTLNLVYDLVGSEPGILARLGAIHSELGQEDEALRYYLESHEEFPVDMDVLSWLGAHYVKVESYERAVHFFDLAAKMQPGEAKWLLMVASCYRRTQNFDMAFQVYEKVRASCPCITLLGLHGYRGRSAIETGSVVCAHFDVDVTIR